MNIVALRRVALLLSGLGFLCIKAEIPIQPNFDLQKFSGQWYPISSVTKRGIPMETVAGAPVFKFKTKDMLTWSIDFPIKEKCKKDHYSLLQLDQPGKYKLVGQYIVRIVETDYTSYYIYHRDSSIYQFLALFARTKKASDVVKAKFKNLASSLGFPVNKIHGTRLLECKEPKKYID